MSETDDTDELLLMPIQVDESHMLEDNFVPYYQIVDKLITQVSKLKSRITSIENSSDVSLGSVTNSIDTFLNMRSSDSSNACRRCYSYESLPKHSEYQRSTLPQCFSTQSTPQKPRSKLMLKSFPNSPKYDDDLKQFKRPLHRGGLPRVNVEEGDRLDENGIHRQPLTEESNIIKEIDDFLSNVKTSPKPRAVRNLEFDQVSNEYAEKQSRDVLDVEQLLKEMDKQEEKIKIMNDDKADSNSTKNSEANEVKNNVDWSKGIETLSMTSSDSSITDRSTVLYRPAVQRSGIVKEFVSQTRAENKDSKINIPSQTLGHSSQSNMNRKSASNNQSSNPSTLDLGEALSEKYSNSTNVTKKSLSTPQFDIHSNANDALTMHKKLLDRSLLPEFNSFFNPSKQSIKEVNKGDLGSVSLINLWSSGTNDSDKNTDKCIQKLQEEKMRRTHCEELIQQLQNKILEQQEKLAVAIQVDEAKDTAIIRFHDAWEKATEKFKLVVKERDQLEKDAAKLASQNEKMVEECEERIEFHRRETDQALTMTQGYQKKLESLQKNLSELLKENDSLKSSTKELENRIHNEEERNKQLSNIIANKEIELTESKNILLHAKTEVAQCQAAVDMCQKDFATIKAEYDLIQDEIKAERLNVSQLHEQNKALHDELEAQKKNETNLVQSLKEAQEKLESNKKELRNFYQGQVELLVQTKLKEFQKQLDEAEQKMKEELAKKELEIAKSAALHIQQINDKYSLEINLLEQKHREEMQLKQVKMAQLEQRLHDLQAKFDRQQDKRADLMKQLQKVMEAQWNEALRIINNGKSPIPPDDSSSTIDQLHSLHSKSYQNMEALLTQEFEEKMRQQQQVHNGNEGNHHAVQGDRRGHTNKHEGSFNQRMPRSKNTKSHDDGNLQRYINLLLHKQPGNPLESKEKTKSPPKFPSEHPTTDRSMWQHPDPLQGISYSNFPENDPHKEGGRKKTQWK